MPSRACFDSRKGRPMADQQDDRSTLVKLRELTGFVRTALDAYDDETAGVRHADGCSCAVCGAIRELRALVRGLEFALARLLELDVQLGFGVRALQPGESVHMAAFLRFCQAEPLPKT